MTVFNSPVPNARHFTDGDGDSARLRVDVGQTGFFDGREFRTFRRITIAAGGTSSVPADAYQEWNNEYNYTGSAADIYVLSPSGVAELGVVRE